MVLTVFHVAAVPKFKMLLAMVLLRGLLVLVLIGETDASPATSMTVNASKLVDISACDSPRGPRHGRRPGLELLQTHVGRLKGSGSGVFGMSSAPTMQSPQIEKVLHVGGGILLLCFLLVLKVASTDILVGMAIFLDTFMTFGLLTFAPTVTPNYQLIAVLQSSKNVVACLLVPVVGNIDGNEAKSVGMGLLCAMLCSLGFALEKNYALWLAMRTLSGCSTTAVFWGGFALLNRVYANDATARVKAVSTAMAGLYMGTFSGPQVAGIFVGHSRSMFLLLSGVQLSVFLALRFRLTDLSQLREPMPKKQTGPGWDAGVDAGPRNPKANRCPFSRLGLGGCSVCHSLGVYDKPGI